MALEWIQDNIAYFGGDSKNVSLFGLDGGGCSASLLTMVASNPKNKECIFFFSFFYNFQFTVCLKM